MWQSILVIVSRFLYIISPYFAQSIEPCLLWTIVLNTFLGLHSSCRIWIGFVGYPFVKYPSPLFCIWSDWLHRIQTVSTLPALEDLQSAWEKKHDAPKYALYKEALGDGLAKLRKYYSRLDEKPSFVLALGEVSSSLVQMYTNEHPQSFHPYSKLVYIKLSWGGPEEQAAEIMAGNLDAKDWHD